MELDDLRKQWADYDRKIDMTIRLNAGLIRQSGLDRAGSALRRQSRWIIFELLVNLAAVVLLGMFIGNHLGEPRLLMPAAVLDVCAILLVASTAHQLAALRTIDYGAPVITIQKRLEQLRIRRIQATKWVLLLSPILWTPLFVVGMKGLFGLDAYAAPGWLALNLAFGLAVTGLLMWVSRRHADWWTRSPFVRRMMDDVAGRNLAAATGFLLDLSRFEEESPRA